VTELIGTIETGDLSPAALAAGFGALWLLRPAAGALLRLDPRCHVIRGSHRRPARLYAQATAPPNGRQFPCRRRKLYAIAYSTVAPLLR